MRLYHPVINEALSEIYGISTDHADIMQLGFDIGVGYMTDKQARKALEIAKRNIGISDLTQFSHYFKGICWNIRKDQYFKMVEKECIK